MPTINNALNEQFTQYSTITGGANNAINNVAPSATSGVPLISQGASAQPLYGTAAVAGGGTGVATFGNTSALLATGTSATGALQNIASVAVGQVLISAGTSTLAAWSATLPSAVQGNITTTGTITTGIWNGSYVQTTRPAFEASKNGNANSVTGDGTAYTITTWSGFFDQASNFNTTSGTFTAPVAGRYIIGLTSALSGLTSSHVIGVAQILTTGQTVDIWRGSPASMKTSGNFLTLSGSALVNMAANDTATFVVTISSGTKVVNIVSGSTVAWAYLVC